MNPALKDTLRDARSSVESVVTLATKQPPRRIRRGISPLWFDFKGTGRDQVEFLTELAGLKPDDDVLDIGCGVGRVALRLAEFISDDGSYDGFDVSPSMIEWCTHNITRRRPNFRFHEVKVRSTTVGGTAEYGSPADFEFGFEDKSFDLAYAGSLFTHLEPEAAANYMAESARVLRPGGRLVATFNLYNSGSNDWYTPARLAKVWPFDHGYYRLKEEAAPESNVAYDEGWVRECVAKAGLTLIEPIRPDASYSPARAPKRGEAGANLWYSMSIIAIRS